MNKVTFSQLQQSGLFVIYDDKHKAVVFRKSIDPIYGTCVASDSKMYSSGKYYKFDEDQKVIKL